MVIFLETVANQTYHSIEEMEVIGLIEVLICEDAYNLIGNSDLALAASGTVTLETAILKTPMIIFYKTSFLSYLLFRYIFNVQIIGLPNIVMGKKFVPELVQNNCTPQKLTQESIEILEKKNVYQRMKENFLSLKKKLTIPELTVGGVYKNTAEYLHKQKYLNRH